ncbi:neuroligin-1-like, partial [Ctenocephalides felis]|uniref:neuroligin-1-like n=1 Tax=Ctenocephalides felis TaxID=7515 RepID=UPI000E6E1DCB
RTGTVFGEDLPFVLGLPGPPLFPANSTVQDRQVADLFIQYLANFARTGNPNGPSTDSRPDHTSPQPYWDSYDTINQLYLELGGPGLVSSVRTHYRGHKLSAWLSLIPQLHGNAATMSDLPPRHHHFREEGPQYYDGSVRPQSVFKSAVRSTSTKAPVSTTPTPKEETLPRLLQQLPQ